MYNCTLSVRKRKYHTLVHILIKYRPILKTHWLTHTHSTHTFYEICNKSIIKDLIPPEVCHCNTFWNQVFIRNTLDCDQSNVYSSRIVFMSISPNLSFRSFSLYRTSASYPPCEISVQSPVIYVWGHMSLRAKYSLSSYIKNWTRRCWDMAI